MKIGLKKITAKYFSSWWMPTAMCLVSLVACTLASLPRLRPLRIFSNLLLVCLAIALLGILSAGLWNFIKKRWILGVSNLALFPLCGAAAFVFVVVLTFEFDTLFDGMADALVISAFGPSEDGFADTLVIPANIDVAEPQNELDAAPGTAEDAFQQTLLKTLSHPGDDDPTVTADVTALAKVHQDAPAVLRRYLATSPAWRVFTESGNVFATRRWMIGSQWRYEHGHYSQHDIDQWSESGIPDFRSRFTIGFSGNPWARVSADATRMNVGQMRPLILSTHYGQHQSQCMITAGSLVVEVFEHSESKERRLTKAALSHVERELKPLAANPTWETIRGILPAGGIRRGAASFELRNSSQPGLYDSIIWINPGEPGMLYLKAFEVTHGTPLSVDDLKESSNEWIGWSDDAEELFFSNTHFTIYEGDWGKPYAARFEVWLTPDSGAPDRKLLEKVFKIEGWQR